MLFDTHCHLNFGVFDDTWREVAGRCLDKEMYLTVIGAQMVTSRKAIEIASEFKQAVYATVGLHPTHVLGSRSYPEEFDLETYEELAISSDAVVAIGETGVDFYHDDSLLKQQSKVFIEHLQLAQKLKLPVVIHGRHSKDGKQDAYTEILAMLSDFPDVRGVAHCFAGTVEQAQEFVERGFFIGVTGIVTFPNSDILHSVVDQLSIANLVIETDAPYLTPVPHRGTQNSPEYVGYVADEISRIKNISINEVRVATFENGKKLYGI